MGFNESKASAMMLLFEIERESYADETKTRGAGA